MAVFKRRLLAVLFLAGGLLLLPWTTSGQESWLTPALAVAGPLWEDVGEYGARGDNITDDTAAIQMAIDAVSSRGGGVVMLSRGTYLTSGAGLKIRESGVCLSGVNEHVSIIKHMGSNPAITVGEGTICQHNRLERLQIVGTEATSHGILLNDNVIRYNIEDISVSGFKQGAAIKAQDYNHSGHILRSEITNNKIGISIGNHGQFTDISYCKIYFNVKYGIELVDCNVINILSCQIEKNGDSSGASIIARGVDALNIIGCYNEQNQAYPAPFIIFTKGDVASKCHAVNVFGTRSIGNQVAPHSVVIEAVENICFTGNFFNSFSVGIFAARRLTITSVKMIYGQANYLGGPLGDKIF